MIRITLVSLAFYCMFHVVAVNAQEQATPAPTPAPAVPAPPTGDATSYLLMDYQSGYLLAAHNIDDPIEPASLVKMMTAYVAGEELKAGHISLDDTVLVSEKAWRMPGSRMFIEVDTRVSVLELLKGIIIQSGNDASVALAEHVSGSEQVFAQLMNQAGKKIGMQNTNFTNSTGMPDPAMTTTARDMAILAAALVRDHPELYSWHAIKEYEYNSIRQQNRNSLLWRDDTVDGIKTGHTEAAGYCLVASAQRNGMRLISVVAGTESSAARTRLSQALLEYGFRFFETHGMYNAGEAVGTARVWKGEQPELNYGVAQDLFVTVPRGQAARIRKEIILDEPIIAPVALNQRLGEIRLSLGGETLIVRDLIATSATEEAGIISRLLDRVRLMFY